MAKKTGLNDFYYFSWLFSNVMGTSPKQYRHNQLN
ncbi:hypothetical protein ACFSR6_13995 [Pedobacter vanadiisoli]|uniref:HTH araC/xylS-type domain-containing protein n=1 Tax=Pedobacter vanadiisoli TaxID=1761975 RepID=A0ABW5MMV2_9SPHI